MIEERKSSQNRIIALRDELARRNLSGLIVPMADEYQNEYVPEYAQRITWLSGFTGSAGLIIVLADSAAIFSDGRYTLQMPNQVDTGIFECRHISDAPPLDWLADKLTSDDRLGYDPWLHSVEGVERLTDWVAASGATLVAVEDNPLDAVWRDQPAPPLAPVVPHGIEFAGECAADKRGRLAADLKSANINATVITAPDSIAWLLNIRGRDVSNTPLPLSFAILHDDATVDLFLQPEKVSAALTAHLGNQVQLRKPVDFEKLLGDACATGKIVQADPTRAAARVFDALASGGGEVRRGPDPCQLPKAMKNETEIAGMRAAHQRDGVAECRFLHWLASNAENGEIDEIGAADRLQAFRAEGEFFQDLSFPTISGSGPNGAIVHYKADAASNRRLGAGELYLVDSGAQYLDGTTDITRTIAIGPVSAEMRDRFTRVLKGHIALATIRFPKGTTGGALDVLARATLWRAGLDYDHGTGHGVGCYLGVHEGPQRISKISGDVAGGAALAPGMVVSNEPGYYKAGEFGIRIENLLVVRPASEVPGGERAMLSFETLTLAPIDRNLIVPELLDAAERNWLNDYHDTVRDTLSPRLPTDTAEWLAKVCQPI